MEEFFNKHLSLANKNNIIKITLGSKKSEEIFKRDISDKQTKNIIQLTKSLHNKITFKNYKEDIYYKGNEKYIISNGEIVYLINETIDFAYDSNMLLTRENIHKDDYIIPSHEVYDNIETFEVLEISVVSCFNLYVYKNKKSSKNYIEIVISKPNNINKIMNFIKEINK
jgi:hypothetical protein